MTRGQGLLEYILVIFFVSLLSILGLSLLGGDLSDTFDRIGCEMRDGENCDSIGGMCGHEQFSARLTCWNGGTELLAVANTDCEGAEIDLQSYGNLPKVDTDYGRIFVSSLVPDVATICAGVSEGQHANGTFSFTSWHPDDRYNTYNISSGTDTGSDGCGEDETLAVVGSRCRVDMSPSRYYIEVTSSCDTSTIKVLKDINGQYVNLNHSNTPPRKTMQEGKLVTTVVCPAGTTGWQDIPAGVTFEFKTVQGDGTQNLFTYTTP